MDSDSPRARIDQFFTSKKKRKSLSSASKSRALENEAKNQIGGSPSAKGSLEGYLVTSQDGGSLAKLPSSTCDETSRNVRVKRNLTLETGISSRNEKQDAGISNQGRPQSPKVSGAAQISKSKPLPDLGGVSEEGPLKNYSESVDVVRNSELKEFANGFLSLYCSDLPPRVSLPTDVKDTKSVRHSNSPISEEKPSKRQHCENYGNQRDIQNGFTSSPKTIQSKIVSRSKILDSNPQEVVMFNSHFVSEASLRKCGNISVECDTPISSSTRLGAGKTPQSTRGSSSFSPGEAFWNEAILVADGVLAPNPGHSSHFAEHGETLKVDCGTSDSNNEKNGGCGNLLRRVSDGAKDTIGVASAVGAPTKHLKGLDKEVSPLPVKHFDFCSEGKGSDRETQSDALRGILTSKESTSASTNHDRSESKDEYHRAQKNSFVSNVEGKPCEFIVPKVKLDPLVQDTGNVVPHALDKRHNRFAANHEFRSSSTPASFSSTKDYLDLNNWLPPEICSVYKKKGISKLYSWQVECLQVDGVLHKRNLVYCASTSAGKSFVAEILMLRRVLSTGKIALLVLPYVSICAEKAEHLEVLLEPVDKHVRSYYGNQGGGTLPKDTSIAVCTIEKANSLINRMLEEGRLSELGTIVIDELHMVGDQSRGYLLELLLTKLRYAAGEGNVESSSGESSGTSSSGKYDPARGLQIVGMSATLPNVAAVANWLQAALYETDFRPVPLEEYIKVGTTIYNKNMEIVRTIPKVADLGGKDPDHIAELCNEVVQEGHSVLIFCSSRKGCESTARHIAKYLKSFSVSPRNGESESFDVSFAMDSLRRSPAGLDPILEECLPVGVAYHHAGLTVEERETVETCYRKGLVRVLTATSTLAAGVNLPARRVIFRQPRIGRDLIDGTRYRQMAGRAGRTGIDTKGESVLICKPDEVKKIMKLLNESCPPLNSCLSEDRNGMTHAILEVVAGGIVQTATDIHRYVRCTLLNSTKPFDDVVKSAQDSLRWLCHKKFLQWGEETKLYTSTPLGRASFGSSLSPEESLIVLDDLSRAREGFVLASDLHLVYLVTPINVDVEPDWELYYERFMQLPLIDQSVGNRVGVEEPFLMRMAHGGPRGVPHRTRDYSKGFQGNSESRFGIASHGMISHEQTLRVCKRFYVALILARLVQEVPVPEVCEGFKVARGMVQALQENAGRFASMVSVFCERLGWHDLEHLLGKFQHRVSFGVRAEIVELTAIPYVKGSRARALYKAGLRTPQAIAEASIPEILKALFESSSWTANGSAQRKVQVGVAKKIKNGARKIVLEKAEEARVAAFAAFQSLGLDIPQFSRPLLTMAAGNALQKESTPSSGEDSTSSFTGLRHPKQVLDVPLLEDRGEITGVAPKFDEDKSNNTPSDRLTTSVKEKPADNTQSKALVEKPAMLEKRTDTLHNELIVTTNCVSSTNRSSSLPLENGGNIENQSNAQVDHVQHQPENVNACKGSRETASEKGPQNAVSIPGGLDSFLDLWETAGEFFFDIHFVKKSELNSKAPFEIQGLAICWQNSPVYYITIPKDLFRCNNSRNNHAVDNKGILLPKTQVEMAKERWIRIASIMERKDVQKITWNLKVQLQVLMSPAIAVHQFSSLHGGVKSLGLDLIENSYLMFCPVHVRNAIDMSIVAWILSPDDERSSYPNLEKEVKKRLSSDAAASANRSGRWKDQMRRAAHNGCCRRVAQTRALFSVLWKLLESEGLVEPLITIEIRLTNILAHMEIRGIGVDMEGCLKARKVLGRKLKCLEREANELAGKTFSLSMPADIANVLYEHLKLPMLDGHGGKQHPSTDKHCLDMLRNEHPVVPVIKEHRTLAKLLNSTLGSICSLARLSTRTQRYTLHGHWLQTSTATGRLSMEEPNLQCVEHMVEFKMDENDGRSGSSHHKINARDFFIPTEDDWLLLAADYSQIELRLMAHFSKDSSLIKLLSSPQVDVFTMIASKWMGKTDSHVNSHERDQTKRLVYGILYGMGNNTLAEQLDCSSEEAAERIRNFKKSFPGVDSWLQEAVTSCHKKGYVETLKGRKRFLTKIKFGNTKEKSKAQRQAVNSICQGSAADIIKIAMICMQDVISEDTGASCPCLIDAKKFQMLKGRCRILLQIHDELIIEADPAVVKEAGLLLQTCMENAVSLLVPLPVKLKVGKTWGSLEPFECNS